MVTELRPEVTASLNGGTEQRVSGGYLSLDALLSPYGECEIRLPLTAAAQYVLDEIDPRDDTRLQVSGSSTDTPRAFDLAVRSRTVDHGAHEVLITAMTDEALLIDWATLTEDVHAFDISSSLRDVIDYVLGLVIPGAALDASPADDADITPLSDSSNLIRNPRAGTNTTDWHATWTAGGLTAYRQASGGPAYAPTYVAWLSNAGVFTNNAEIFYDPAAVPVTAGRRYRLGVSISGTGGRVFTVDAVCFDRSGNITGFIPPKTAAALPGGAWRRVVLDPFEPYTNTANIRVRVRSAQLGGSEYVNVTAWRLSEDTGDPLDTEYFDGATADTALYEYSWPEGTTPHAAISNRRRVDVTRPDPDALRWLPGETAWEFLNPLVTSLGMRLFCDEKRVWRLIRPEAYFVPGQTSLRPSNLTRGLDVIARDDPAIFATGVVVRYTWQTPDGREQQRFDSAGTSNKVAVIDYARPYPGPGAAAAILARRDGTGRVQSVTALADWTSTPGQAASIILPNTVEQRGKVNTVRWELSDDALMDVGTNGLVDVQPGSIDALSGTIDALSGTVDSLQ